MKSQCLFDVATVDELIHLPVGIARDIAQHRMTCWRLVESVNRHDRKKLLYRPAIRHALKQREIAEIRIREHALEPFQFFRKVVEFLRKPENLPANRPVEILSKATLLKRKISQAKEIERRVERLLCVVVRFEQILLA